MQLRYKSPILDLKVKYYREVLANPSLADKYVLIPGFEICVPCGGERRSGFSHHFLGRKMLATAMLTLRRHHSEHGGFPNLREHHYPEVRVANEVIQNESWRIEWGEPIDGPEEFPNIECFDIYIGRQLGFKEEAIKKYMASVHKFSATDSNKMPRVTLNSDYCDSSMRMKIFKGDHWIDFDFLK